jgi:hypothetical protein
MDIPGQNLQSKEIFQDRIFSQNGYFSPKIFKVISQHGYSRTKIFSQKGIPGQNLQSKWIF